MWGVVAQKQKQEEQRELNQKSSSSDCNHSGHSHGTGSIDSTHRKCDHASHKSVSKAPVLSKFRANENKAMPASRSKQRAEKYFQDAGKYGTIQSQL